MLHYNPTELEEMFAHRGEVSGVGALGGQKPAGQETPRMAVELLEEDRLVIRRQPDVRDLRPGAFWSGPSLITLVDAAAFMMAMAHLPPGSDALTQELSAKFLRPAPFGELMADAHMLRLAKRTAVMAVAIISETVTDGPVCHATTTFALRLPRSDG